MLEAEQAAEALAAGGEEGGHEEIVRMCVVWWVAGGRGWREGHASMIHFCLQLPVPSFLRGCRPCRRLPSPSSACCGPCDRGGGSRGGWGRAIECGRGW
jgi:hypothetical protein